MHIETPNALDVVASGIHDTKNRMFDAMARINLAVQTIHAGNASEALPILAKIEDALSDCADRLSKSMSAYRLIGHENPISMVPSNIPELVDDVMQRVLSGYDGGIAFDIERSFDDFWILDRELVADSLVNAIRNALRFARSRLLIKVFCENQTLHLMVEDDGPGFPALMPAHDDGTNSGVGLYIARRIAQLHVSHGEHGSLVLDRGEVLGGALFHMMLPR
jgi:signal transduction histidine kinase